jgi:hypothetical protein
MPQLHTYVEARLGRWSRWYHWGIRPGPRPVVSWYEVIVLAPNVQGRGSDQSAVCPVDEQEAIATHKAVVALPDKYRAIVFEAYLKGGTVDQQARALHCCKQTYYNRLTFAYALLLGYFNDLDAGVELPAQPRPDVPVETKRLTKLDGFRKFAGKLA